MKMSSQGDDQLQHHPGDRQRFREARLAYQSPIGRRRAHVPEDTLRAAAGWYVY